jgi:hypothetical protein
MKNLYLYIGSHKTGSTSIQKYCIENRKELHSQNYEYFYTSPHGRPIHDGNCSEWVDESPITEHEDKGRITPSAKIRNLEALVKSLEECKKEHIVLSAEALSSIHSEHEIARIHKNLSRHFKTKIIVYLRRQDLQVVSHNQEGSKGRRWPAFHYYGSLKALPDTSKVSYHEYLDYNSRLLKWAECFGYENIIIRVFERASLVGGCVVKDFFRTVGLQLPQGDIVNHNVTLGFKSFKIGMLMNKANCDGEIFQSIRDAISAKENDVKKKALPSRSEAKKFYQIHKNTNKLLKEKFNLKSESIDLFDNDFSMYSEISQDEWDENSANEAILSLFEVMVSEHSKIQHGDKLNFEKTSMEERFLKLISKIAPSSRLRKKIRNLR